MRFPRCIHEGCDATPAHRSLHCRVHHPMRCEHLNGEQYRKGNHYGGGQCCNIVSAKALKLSGNKLCWRHGGAKRDWGAK